MIVGGSGGGLRGSFGLFWLTFGWGLTVEIGLDWIEGVSLASPGVDFGSFGFSLENLVCQSWKRL